MGNQDELKALLRPTLKLCISVAGLLFLRALLGLLPGAEREIPQLGFELGILIIAVLTLIITGVLCYYSLSIRAATEDLRLGTADQRAVVGRVVQLFLVLFALLVLHSGLGPLVSAVAERRTSLLFLFDAAFLLAGLAVLLYVSYLALQNVDPVVDSLVEAVGGGSSTNEPAAASDGGSNHQSNSVVCSSCGTTLPNGAAFCSDCGTRLQKTGS